MSVVVLNPGQMGSVVAASLVQAGRDTAWVSEGRSPSSRERAQAAGLREISTIHELKLVDVVVSVVPPASALETATKVADAGFRGIYVDGNAVSPSTANAVYETVTQAGASFVDGGIIGPPPEKLGDARLYLSGEKAHEVAALFEGSVMDARAIEEAPGSCAASSLKMAYAGWTKGSSALLLAVRAMARAHGVEQALLDEWGISQAGLEGKSNQAAIGNAFKAWRFVGEKVEISNTMQAGGLPAGFHQGAAELYEALAEFKDQMDTPPETVYQKLSGN